MNDSLCIVGVMGSRQSLEASGQVPPGGDSREQRVLSHLPVEQKEEKRKQEREQE